MCGCPWNSGFPGAVLATPCPRKSQLISPPCTRYPPAEDVVSGIAAINCCPWASATTVIHTGIMFAHLQHVSVSRQFHVFTHIFMKPWWCAVGRVNYCVEPWECVTFVWHFYSPCFLATNVNKFLTSTDFICILSFLSCTLPCWGPCTWLSNPRVSACDSANDWLDHRLVIARDSTIDWSVHVTLPSTGRCTWPSRFGSYMWPLIWVCNLCRFEVHSITKLLITEDLIHMLWFLSCPVGTYDLRIDWSVHVALQI